MTNEIKHTHGKWEVESIGFVHKVITKMDDDIYAVIAHLRNDEGLSDDVQFANAHLIARTPELLETVERIYDRLSDLPLACRSPEEWLNELVGWIEKEILPMCTQVIAKAKGSDKISKVEHKGPRLKVDAGVRYWEDSKINGMDTPEDGAGFPCKNGDRWQPVIDIDSGKIINWEIGVVANVHFKVCDDGCYYLLDANDNTIAEIIDDYVPRILCPKENGYGDYIIMDIDENGFIKDFDKTKIDRFIEVSHALKDNR